MTALLALLLACIVDGGYPDPSCTPGVCETKDVKIICHRKTKTVRHVTVKVHKAVLVEYGYDPAHHPDLEVDHDCPLELGGSNGQANLWAQPAPDYHRKDVLENRLHKLVCEGALNLEVAQKAILQDWQAAYFDFVEGGVP